MRQDGFEILPARLVAYLAYDSSDSSVIKRAAMFRDAGLEVQGIMFHRKRVNLEYVPEWNNISLGTIEDQAFVRRVASIGGALLRIWKHRRRLANVSLVYARNLDLAILGIFLQIILPRRPQLIYEVLDIHKMLTSDSAPGRVLRFVERMILKRTTCLVVSSPQFINAYFTTIQEYQGPHHLVENKLTPKWLQRTQGHHKQESRLPRRKAPPWVLGWFGAIRCPVSLNLLTQLAATLPDHFVLYIRGVPVDLGRESFYKAIEVHANIVYDGRYRNPEDLEDVYARVDFNWCVDMVTPDANSKWLLPNRIYEGGYFNCPAIATRNSATGQKVDSLGLGYTFEEPYLENLVEFFKSMTIERHQAMVRRIARLSRTEFCDDAQFRALLNRLSRGPW